MNGKSRRLRRYCTLKQNPASGFTIIELMVTLLIAAILSLISVAYYQRASQRFSLQSEAINLAARLEQAKSLAQAESTEYRLLFAGSGFTAQFINPRGSVNWVPAPAISAGTIPLSSKVSFGTGSVGSPPEGQASMIQAGEIRFNSRGFPVDLGTPPTAPRQNNAVYLTDGADVYAVTVNILGRVQVWAYDNARSIWVAISR